MKRPVGSVFSCYPTAADSERTHDNHVSQSIGPLLSNSLVLGAIVTEACAQCDGHYYQGHTPSKRVVGPHDALVEEHFDQKHVEVDTFNQLPGKGAQE